jgi:O-antigen ligase
MKKENTSNSLDYFLFGIYFIFFVSIIFSFRAVSSISIGLILMIGLFRNRKISNGFADNNSFYLFLIGCGLLFILQSLSLLFTKNFAESIKLLQRSSGLIFIPAAVFASHKFLTPERNRELVFYFGCILSIASLYCLVCSLFKFFSGASASVFFYHDLVKPISQHAIQFSLMVFITLVFLVKNLKERESNSTNFLSRIIIIFLSFFLILLSSKLVISFYILYLLPIVYKKFQERRGFIIPALIAAVIILTATPNPVGNRFRAISTGNFMLFTQKKFSPGVYFNGVQFRLLQWRFTYEILNEQNAWLLGVTPGDAQSMLDKKYVETNMYTGIAGTEKKGFLGYHTHNQFLQALIENGLLGIAVFLLICYSLFKMAREHHGKELKWVIFLLFAYCFTDAPFKTQYGLIIFTFFPAFLYFGKQVSLNQNHSKVVAHICPKIESNYALPEVIARKQPN